jgi:ATP-binding cassette subfamily G (WHITE) protein 2 (PDR)
MFSAQCAAEGAPDYRERIGDHTKASRSSLEHGRVKTEEQHNREVQELVRQFTAKSAEFGLESPFAAVEGSYLDPKSDQFRAKDWARAFYNIRYSSEESNHRVAGIAFKNLNVWGKGSQTDFQSTVGNKILKLSSLFGRGDQKIEILRDLDGLLLPGEQLCVLGPPGYQFHVLLSFQLLTYASSGCSTLLKTIAGETHGFQVSPESYLNYQGISAKHMNTMFKGEAIYTAEVDAHFPQLSVGDTLYFAALARAPRQIPGGVSRSRYAQHLRDVSPLSYSSSLSLIYHR